MLNAVLALNELDTKVFDSPIPGEAPRIYDSHVTVPDAHLLFNGEFKRVGSNDLKIVGEDGESFFIQDYFASETRAHLMSPEGATLSASVVEALAGPLAPGQHAQAGGQAASTQPVIGRVDALSGSATVVRNGVTVSLNVGDTVRKGDVVQTSGGSSVAIVFTDGSTFSLNANARMVLDEFVYAAGGTGNTALISLVQGTFSFVAGQVAKNGDMRVETPVATMGIRGTAVLVEISANDGQTRFSVMVEPDGTTGSFNLYNKTTGALIGTVSNSQVGWVVTPAGPLQVVAQQVQKTPGELAQELGIVQQIFTIFDNNQQNPFVPTQDRGDNPNNANPQTAQGGGGSGTPPPDTTTTNNPLVDLINTISNNPSTPPSGATVQLPTDPLPINPGSPPPPPVTVIVSANQPPVAVDDPDGTPDGGNVITPTDPEVPGTDLDPEGSVLRVMNVQRIVDGELQGDPVPVGPEGAVIVGAFGTLTINEDGEYAFEPNAAYAALPDGSEPVFDKFQYTITDPFGATATAVLTINLKGVNDAPVVTGAVTGTATEDRAAVTLDALANASDVDAETILSVDDVPEVLPAGVTYDSETGSFTLDPGNAAYQSLAAGQQITVQVSYNVSDGTVKTPASVSWTVTGTNDAPVVSGVVTGAAIEDGAAVALNALANASDIDAGSSLSVVDVLGALPAGVTFNSQTGAFTLDPGHTAYQSLAAGQQVTVQVTYNVSDGTAKTPSSVSWTVTGTNDAPVVTGAVTGTATEDGPTSTLNALANASDIDAVTTLSVVDVPGTLPAGVTFNSATGTFTLDPDNAAYHSLAAGQQVTVQVTYNVSDGTAKTPSSVSWTVTGTNDAPVVTGAVTGTATEDGPTSTLNALANASDIDAGSSLSVADVPSTLPAGVTFNNATGTFTLDPGHAAYQSLAAGQQATVQVTYNVYDGTAKIPASVSWTVTGTNDAPVVSGVVTGAAIEDGAAVALNALANASDIDAGSSLSVVDVPGTLPAGVTFNSQTGTFTLDPGHSAYQSLAAGQQATVQVTYNVYDGTAKTPASVSWTVTGTADGPVANNDTATMNENDVVFVNVLANDAPGATSKSLVPPLGTVTVTGPEGVQLGTPEITIQNNQIKVSPGTAFDALALGETATIAISYTMQDSSGATASAIATVSVTGTNDEPYFTVLPENLDTLGVVGPGQIDGVDALKLTSQGVFVQQLDDFLQLTDASIANVNGGATNGSAAAFDVFLVAGQAISFSWFFDADDYLPYNDFAFFSVALASDYTQKLSDISVVRNYGDSGWQVTTFTADDSGLYRLGFGVANVGDINLNSYLYIGGFTGIGLNLIASEDDAPLAIDLLEGAQDLDATDELTATVLELAGTNDLGVSIDVTGAVTINGNSVTVDPAYFSSLSDEEIVTIVIDYDVTDGTATVQNSATLVINGANDAPVANAVAASGDEDAYSIAVTLSGSDIDGTVSGFKLNSLPLNGDLSLDGFSTILDEDDLQQIISAYEGTGTIYFRPHDDWNGQTTFDYVAIDNDNAEGAAGTATITVAPINDAPQVIGFNPNRSVGESSVAGMALGHILADDPDGDSLTYSLAPESSDHFTINEFTGELSASGSASLGVYAIGVVVTDKDGLASEPREITVAIGHDSINGYQNYSSYESDVISYGLGGNDIILGGYGNDALIGGNGNDTLRSNYGNDVLIGGAGADWLSGGGGRDIIEGGSGNDTIRGGEGNDELTGGSGNDRFYFEPGEGKDVIVDFTIGDPLENADADIIRLHNFGYEDVSDLVLGESDQGFLRIDLGNGQWIDLNGVSPSAQLNNSNFIFSSSYIGV